MSLPSPAEDENGGLSRPSSPRASSFPRRESRFVLRSNLPGYPLEFILRLAEGRV
jgi:hypothetical protein